MIKRVNKTLKIRNIIANHPLLEVIRADENLKLVSVAFVEGRSCGR